MDSVWTREPRRQRNRLTREAIVAAAIAIADRDGIDAVSLRRIATELEARTMSLYTYIDRKEDLLDLMADEVSAETLHEPPLPGDWREATLAIARLERDTVRRHPWMISLIGRRTVTGHIGPNMIRNVEQSLAALDGLDAPDDVKWRIVVAVSDYTTGFVLRDARQRGTMDSTDVEARLRSVVTRDEYPHLTAQLAAPPPDTDDDNFEEGLRWLLDGATARPTSPGEEPGHPEPGHPT